MPSSMGANGMTNLVLLGQTGWHLLPSCSHHRWRGSHCLPRCLRQQWVCRRRLPLLPQVLPLRLCMGFLIGHLMWGRSCPCRLCLMQVQGQCWHLRRNLRGEVHRPHEGPPFVHDGDLQEATCRL